MTKSEEDAENKWLTDLLITTVNLGSTNNNSRKLYVRKAKATIQAHTATVAAEAARRAEGIGAYMAASSLMVPNMGYLLEHRRQGLPEMTSQVIVELYAKAKFIMDENVKYMRSSATLNNTQSEKGTE